MRVHFPASLLQSAAPEVLGADLPGEVMSEGEDIPGHPTTVICGFLGSSTICRPSPKSAVKNIRMASRDLRLSGRDAYGCAACLVARCGRRREGAGFHFSISRADKGNTAPPPFSPKK